MDEDENIYSQDPWAKRAGKAYAHGNLLEFLKESVAMGLMLIAGILGLLAMFAVPLQGAFEVIYWLETAEWANYDWYWYLGHETAFSIANTEFKGVNAIIHYVLDCWISLPFGIVGTITYFAIVGDGY